MKGEVEYMLVLVDVNFECLGYFFIFVVEFFVYIVYVSFIIECFINYVVMVEIEFSESRFYLFIQCFVFGLFCGIEINECFFFYVIQCKGYESNLY